MSLLDKAWLDLFTLPSIDVTVLVFMSEVDFNETEVYWIRLLSYSTSTSSF